MDTYGIDIILKHFGPTPILILLIVLITIILWGLCSLTSLSSKLIEWAEKADKMYLAFGARYQEQIDMASRIKRKPCDMCGVKYYFLKHPTANDIDDTICICDKCKSNQEGWSKDWIENKQNSSLN